MTTTFTEAELAQARKEVAAQCAEQGVTVHLDPARLGPIARWLALPDDVGEEAA